MNAGLDTTVLEMTRAQLLQDYPTHIHACLDILDDEQIWWRPHEATNSVANLVLHLAGSNRFHLDHVIGGSPNVRNRDWEFAIRGGQSTADVRKTWDDAIDIVAPVIAALTPARLLETTDRGGRTVSVLQVLAHVTQHNALHIGQIIWITKMLVPGGVNELLRPRSR